MWTTKHSFLSVRCTDTASDCWELDMVTFVYRVYHVTVIVCIICHSHCVLYMSEPLMYGEEIYAMW